MTIITCFYGILKSVLLPIYGYSGYNSGYFSELEELSDGSKIIGGAQEIWYYDENEVTRESDDLWIVYTDADGCLLDDCEYLQDLTSSLCEPYVYNISLYPNPTSDILNIRYPELIDMDDLALYDLTGKLVYYIEEPNSGLTIDRSRLSNGLYVVKGQVKGGGVWTDKVVVEYY